MRRILITVTAAALVTTACSADPVASSPSSYTLKDNPYRGKTLKATFQPDWGLPLAAEDADGRPVGFVIELAEAAAKELGATFKVIPNDFSTTIPGVQSGKYDIGNGADATVERQKVVDVVSVTKTGYTFLTTKAGGRVLADNVDALCGLRIAQIAGNSVLDALKAQAKVCDEKGLGKLRILTFPDKSSSFLAVQSGRADTTSIYGAQGGYLVKQDPSWVISGPTVISGETGFAVNKDTGNAKLWARAVDAAIADGSYGRILKKYGIEFIGLKQSTVNPAK